MRLLAQRYRAAKEAAETQAASKDKAQTFSARVNAEMLFRQTLENKLGRDLMPTLKRGQSVQGSDIGGRGSVYKYKGPSLWGQIDLYFDATLQEIREQAKPRLLFVFCECRSDGRINPHGQFLYFTLLELKLTKAFHR